MDSTLHPTPRFRHVVREQIRAVGLSLRREALVVAVVVGIVTVVIAMDIVRGNAETWFDSDDWIGFGLISFLLPFAVWRRERRFGPAFLWTLPVDRRRLALAKVFGGWVWLMAALMFFVFWQIALAAFSGVAGAETVTLLAFIGTTATYLFGSALVLGLRHPLRWLFGTAAVFFLLGFFNETVGGRPDTIDTLLRSSGFASRVHAAATRWQTLPSFAQWAISTFLSVGAGLAALWAAASRHRERRRR
jgi:hypothetical protein